MQTHFRKLIFDHSNCNDPWETYWFGLYVGIDLAIGVSVGIVVGVGICVGLGTVIGGGIGSIGQHLASGII